MARRSFYEVLEISATATPEAIHAAHGRLSAKYAAAPMTDARARMKLEAAQEAFDTLSDPVKRARYDQQSRWRAPQARVAAATQQQAELWRWPAAALGAVMVLALASLYVQHRANESRLRTEAAIAQARAQEMAERAATTRAEILAVQAGLRHTEERRVEEIRAQGQVQLALLQYQTDVQRDMQRERLQAEAEERQRVAREQALQREQQRRQEAETRRRQEEAQAAIAARQQLQRDRAELCLLERNRYGRVLSC